MTRGQLCDRIGRFLTICVAEPRTHVQVWASMGNHSALTLAPVARFSVFFCPSGLDTTVVVVVVVVVVLVVVVVVTVVVDEGRSPVELVVLRNTSTMVEGNGEVSTRVQHNPGEI